MSIILFTLYRSGDKFYKADVRVKGIIQFHRTRGDGGPFIDNNFSLFNEANGWEIYLKRDTRLLKIEHGVPENIPKNKQGVPELSPLNYP